MKTKWNWLFDRPGRSRKSLGTHTARRLCVEHLENRLLLTAATLDWAVGIGSAEARDESYDVATDAAGNSYMAGWFSGSMDFDPGPGTHILTSVGLHDTFVAKYSSAGEFAWATQMGGPGNDSYDYAYSIAAGQSHVARVFGPIIARKFTSSIVKFCTVEF